MTAQGDLQRPQMNEENMHLFRYQCNECGMRFWLQSEIMVHQQQSCPARRHHCNLCNMRFMQAGELGFHQWEMHGGPYPQNQQQNQQKIRVS